jgi:hypothetical protein
MSMGLGSTIFHLRAAGFIHLNRRTFNRTITAKHTAVSVFWLQ